MDLPQHSWNHESTTDFYRYYADESLSDATRLRYEAIRDTVMRVREPPTGPLMVADIGCGAGTQSLLWAQEGHSVLGVDINRPLITLARERGREAGLARLRFEVGSATAIPAASASFDVCLVPELLEHVAPWRDCLLEFSRVLRPGGILYLSTTNVLCPRQQEFSLPLYSWYPAFAKRRFERLAMTSHPHLAGHATYPAVNWFSFYSLRRALAPLGFRCLDRFDLMHAGDGEHWKRRIRDVVRGNRALRLLAHVATPYTVLVGIKKRRNPAGAAEFVA